MSIHNVNVGDRVRTNGYYVRYYPNARTIAAAKPATVMAVMKSGIAVLKHDNDTIHMRQEHLTVLRKGKGTQYV